jgi:PKD repeat protein/uncharacterized membrane protein YphA (DoxX/SURF4 family)/thiol-disulfide isomerase/thioredoxin
MSPVIPDRKWWLLGLRIILGSTFIVAGISKLPLQAQFINEVAGYGFLPHGLAVIYGSSLPWVELATGCALILGIFLSPALILCGLMTLSFIIANIFTLSRGISDDCGCFGQIFPLSHSASLTLDILMIIIVAVLIWFRTHLSFLSLATAISGLILNRFRTLMFLSWKISQVIIILIFVLAIGLPLTLTGSKDGVYSEIDSSLGQGEPVFLFFYQAGCGECEKQQIIVDNLAAKYKNYIRFIPLDFQKEARVAVKFNVVHAPTILLISPKNTAGYLITDHFSQLTSQEDLQSSFYKILNTLPAVKTREPVAEFKASILTGNAPLEVNFHDFSLGDIQNWDWDFDNDGNIDSNHPNPDYIFKSPGDYAVSLKVSGPRGSSTITKPTFIHIAPGICQASFYAEPTRVDGLNPVQFFDQSQGDILRWEWDFDRDGTVDSTERNPSHTYKDGIYSVSLTVSTQNAQDTLIRSNYITVTGCG